jgi:acetoin utilization protein AcuB
MFCGQLISHTIPQLHLHDKVYRAIQYMDEYKVSHLPVVLDEKYAGIVSEEDLIDADPELTLQSIYPSFGRPFVRFNDHFMMAARLVLTTATDLVPVLNETDELEGVITLADLTKQLAAFTGADQEGSLIVLEMERKAYAFGEINRLVESNDATITQINTTIDSATQLLTVTLRINKKEVSDVVATLQRHEYTIKYFHGEELYPNELQNNLEHLMNYLSI